MLLSVVAKYVILITFQYAKFFVHNQMIYCCNNLSQFILIFIVCLLIFIHHILLKY